MNQELVIDNKKVKVTNLSKVFWTNQGYTKGDLISYYRSVSKYILPYLQNRPESLHRFPNGIKGSKFYQKNVETHPDWVKIERVWSESTNEYINFVVCNDEATLIYLANLGCIEMNVWNSGIPNLDKPDYLVIDLDPEGIEFDAVLQTALEINNVFESIGIKGYPKTSGATGIHIYVPLGAKYTYDQVRQFAKIIVSLVHQKLPEITSVQRRPEKRQHCVYLDYIQNGQGATMASPYSVRPVEAAGVSTPVTWEEIQKGIKPEDFTIKNIQARLEKIGDIYKPVLNDGIDLNDALDKLHGLT